mmetsp:Transcript_32331/g.60164  ORF Transcript_32331/g.60164 Transcript_32331/m.60164 type:complete len:114 (+) Transcript_32331:486-827(+)
MRLATRAAETTRSHGLCIDGQSRRTFDARSSDLEKVSVRQTYKPTAPPPLNEISMLHRRSCDARVASVRIAPYCGGIHLTARIIQSRVCRKKKGDPAALMHARRCVHAKATGI